MIKRHPYVISFDLDDTIYHEHDYMLSGMRAVANFVLENYEKNVSLTSITKSNDFLGEICKQCQLPESVKNELIWVYRLHSPTIRPRAGVVSLWKTLKARDIPICIITDGRSTTQRLKMAALDLKPDGVFISEEVGAEKPDARAFILAQEHFPASNYVYVADNPNKDFFSPNQLSWLTIGMIPEERNIHKPNEISQTMDYQPKLWLEDFDKLSEYLLTLI